MNVEESKAAATSVYKGKTYYFCAVNCKERFDREPEKYIKETAGEGHSRHCC
jgi:Cu+-exporting ATPase